MTHRQAAPALSVSAAFAQPSVAFLYRLYISLGLFLLMLFLLTFHYSEVGFFILVLISAVFCADIFVRSAWQDLWRGKIGFPLLVSVAVYSGFLYSVLHTFLSTAMFGPVEELYLYISLFVTLSLWVQYRRVKKTERVNIYIKKIDDFLPKSGRKRQADAIRMVFAGELKPGDEILVKPGERFACDGTILEGKTSVDEQLITGSVVPTYKQPGSTVYAGTVNKSAEVWVQVVKPLLSSALMNVVNCVQQCEIRRGKFTSSLDRQSKWTLLGVILVAVGQYAWTMYQHGVGVWAQEMGVLLVMLSACAPLALLFAESFPLFFACRFAASKGIKIQNHYALGLLPACDVVFFDKTGTLTKGCLSVQEVKAASSKAERTLLEVLATLSQREEDVLSKSLFAYTRQKRVSPKKVEMLEMFPGLGVRAVGEKRKMLVGRVQWMEEQGVKIPSDVAQSAQTVICVARDEVYLGYVTLADALRPGAAETIDFLKKKGKEVFLLSGDNEPVVAQVAKQVGIEKFNANVLPQTKAEIITNLRALNKKTVMVGDGFNDIVALLNADAGIAYSSANNVYANWVDILIYRRDLGPLAELFKLQAKIRYISCVNALVAFLFSVVWVEFLFSRLPQVSDWRWIMGGSLTILLLIFLNSMRLLK